MPTFLCICYIPIKKKKSTFESTPRTTHFLSRPCSCSRPWSYCSLNISTRHLPNIGTVLLILRGFLLQLWGGTFLHTWGMFSPNSRAKRNPWKLRSVWFCPLVPCDTQPGCPCPPLSDSPAPGSPPWAAPAPPTTPRGSHGAHLLFPLQGP